MRNTTWILLVLASGCGDPGSPGWGSLAGGDDGEAPPASQPHLSPELPPGRYILSVGSLHSSWEEYYIDGVSLSDDGTEGHTTMGEATCAFPVTAGTIETTYDESLAGDEVIDDTITGGGAHTAIAPGSQSVWIVEQASPGSTSYAARQLPIAGVRRALLREGGFAAVQQTDGGCAVAWFDLDGARGPSHEVGTSCGDAPEMVLDRASGVVWTVVDGVVVRADAAGAGPIGSSAEHLALDPELDRLYVAQDGTVRASSLDGAAQWEYAASGVVLDIAAVRVDGSVAVLLESDGQKELALVDAATGHELDVVHLNWGASGLASAYASDVFAVVYPRSLAVYHVYEVE
jgi:hypothetical protein